MEDRWDEAFKKKIVDECNDVGDIALVCRRHGLARPTVDRWIKRQKSTGAATTLPKDTRDIMDSMDKEIRRLRSENAALRKLAADKGVETAILKELLEKAKHR